MSDNDRKPSLHHLPALLTGTAALIAALTGVYVNLRDTREQSVPTPAPKAAVQRATVPVPVTQTGPLRLQVERITVEHDGSPGTTDWRFTVEADGEPLFAFSQEALDDSGGRNVVLPKDADGLLRLPPGKTVQLTIRGWRGGLLGFGTKPVAQGEATLGGAGVLPPVHVQAGKPGDGAFVFHLSAEPAR